VTVNGSSPIDRVREHLQARQSDLAPEYVDVIPGSLRAQVAQAVSIETAGAIDRVLMNVARDKPSTEEDLVQVIVGGTRGLYAIGDEDLVPITGEDGQVAVPFGPAFATLMGLDADSPEACVYAVFQIGEIPQVDGLELSRCALEISAIARMLIRKVDTAVEMEAEALVGEASALGS
jgi:hypothetical protein